MGRSLSKLVLTTAISSAVMIVGMSAQAAGRCGGVFAVDKPTTLAHVAQRCNVNLSALYEANTGVDPNNVRPGARLAIPSEINRYAASIAYPEPDNGAYVAPTTTDSYVAPIRYQQPLQSSNYDNMDRDYDRTAHSGSNRDLRNSGKAPAWMRSEISYDVYVYGGKYLINNPLSYQKQSALRIHNAQVPSLQPSLLNPPAARALKTSLIKCTDLRTPERGANHHQRKIISNPENTYVEIVATKDGRGLDCTLISEVDYSEVDYEGDSQSVLPARFTSPTKLAPPDYHLPDYDRIGVTPRMIKINETFPLKGKITDSYAGCLLLETDDNRLWRLASPQHSSDLIGKTVTIWGKASMSGACGGGATMIVSHAIYAEPWAEN